MKKSIHRRQFVLSDGPFEAPPLWIARPLPDGWTLHAHPELLIRKIETGAHMHALVLGNALRFDSADCTGTGRFVVIKWPQVLTDASALLGVYYGAWEGRRVVSSSPVLAAAALHGAMGPPDQPEPLDHRSWINFFPAPGAPYAGLRKLFSDQALDLNSWEIAARVHDIFPHGSYDEALRALEDELCGFAEEIGRLCTGQIHIPLTGGLDSRTLAAAFLATGTPFIASTINFCGKPYTDVSTARAICRKFGIRHRIIDLEPIDVSAASALKAHTGGSVFDWDNTHLFPGNAYRDLEAGDVRIVGGCFEFGRQTSGGHCFQGVQLETVTGREVFRRRAGREGPDLFCDFLEEWLVWRRAHPFPTGFPATYYLDQRLTGWRANIELGYDMLPAISLNPANSGRVFSAMITPDPAAQIEGRLQHDLIHRLVPQMDRLAYNRFGFWRRLRTYARTLKKSVAHTRPWTFEDIADAAAHKDAS